MEGLVTGGDSDIGRAVGLLFTREGATVAFTYVKNAEEKDAQDTLKLFKEHKTDGAVGDPIAIPCNLGFDDECKKVIDAVAKTFGRIDIVVNNAAKQHVVESIEDLLPEQSGRSRRDDRLRGVEATAAMSLQDFVIV